jgi:hypothetical protein
MTRPLSLFLPVVACVMAAAVPAEARLGETKEECIARYGQPLAEVPALLENATGATFLKGEIRIRVEFLDNRAAFLSFSRRGLRLEERQKLLDLNAGPLSWNPSQDFVGRTCWIAPGNVTESPRHAAAYQAADTGYLDLASDAWTKAMRAQQAVQFAIMPRALTPAPVAAPEIKPDTKAPLSKPATDRLEGF